MKGKKLSKAGVAQRLAVSSLNDVEIRGTIAFDQLKPVLQQGDVPADNDPIGECCMGALN
jgi:hypothetical protein